MCTVLHAGAIRGGYDLPDVLSDDKVLTAPRGLDSVTKVYFRECNLSKAGNYTKHMPYHQGNGEDVMTKETPFPVQCGNELGDNTNYTQLTKISKQDNLIVEVFAQPTGNVDWVRVGIVHLVCHPNKYVELLIICMDPVKFEGQSLFTKALDFVKHFARGNAPEESTEDATTLYKYSHRSGAYGTPAYKTQWQKAGNFIVLDATTLRSMTVYMHSGFVFASRDQKSLFNETFVGPPEKQKGTTVAMHKEELDSYFDHCCDNKIVIGEPPPNSFSKPLWQAMQVLHTFKSNKSVHAVQTQFDEVTSFIKDELDPQKVTGTAAERFTYATFALLVSLALLYTNPKGIVMDYDDNPRDGVENEPTAKGAYTAQYVSRMCKKVHDVDRAVDVAKALTDEMLVLASHVKQREVIPMVLRND